MIRLLVAMMVLAAFAASACAGSLARTRPDETPEYARLPAAQRAEWDRAWADLMAARAAGDGRVRDNLQKAALGAMGLGAGGLAVVGEHLKPWHRVWSGPAMALFLGSAAVALCADDWLFPTTAERRYRDVKKRLIDLQRQRDRELAWRDDPSFDDLPGARP